MQNNLVIQASGMIVAGLVFTLSGCNNSKADRHEATAQSVKIDTTYEDVAIPEVVDNTSDVYFERTVAALRKHDYKEATIELKSGIGAFEEEAQLARTAPLGTLDEQLAKMKALIPQVEAGKATPDEVEFTTGVGELLVAHDKIEKLESVPVYTAETNLHMRQVLKDIEKNTEHLGEKARQEGKTVVKDARTALDDFDKAAANDSRKAETNVKSQFSKVKAFIKKNS